MAAIAEERKLAGIIVYGYVRDSSELKNINIGILALGTMPNRSVKEGKENEIFHCNLDKLNGSRMNMCMWMKMASLLVKKFASLKVSKLLFLENKSDKAWTKFFVNSKIIQKFIIYRMYRFIVLR